MPKNKKGKGKAKLELPQPAALSRLQRVIQKLGLEEIFPKLREMSDGDLQAVLARFLHYGEHHVELGISWENFKLNSLPAVAFNKITMKTTHARSPLMFPHFLTFTLLELPWMTKVAAEKQTLNLDEPPMDSDDFDFLACRFFFRFVAEAVELGFRVVLLQDDQQSVAVLVHIKGLRRLNGDPGTVLLQVEYSCTSKTDEHMMESVMLAKELKKKRKCTSIVGTEHQIHFVKEVLAARGRFLDRTVFAEHDKEWRPREKLLRPSFIVPLHPLYSNLEVRIMQEIKKFATLAASEGTASDPVESTWPSNEKNSLPSGASVLINPMRDWDDPLPSLICQLDSARVPPQELKVNRMPLHKEGEIYVIKAQAGTEDCLIYDRERSFTAVIGDPEIQTALRPAIKAVNHEEWAKAYFYATNEVNDEVGAKAYFYATNEGDLFRVYLEDRPPQDVNW